MISRAGQQQESSIASAIAIAIDFRSLRDKDAEVYGHQAGALMEVPAKLERAPAPVAAPGYPNKRARHSPPTKDTDEGMSDVLGAGGGGGGGKKESTASSFRNVSACNRCRLRKNRCDQKLPSCISCEKAGVKCVGYDPITKREIPRR